MSASSDNSTNVAKKGDVHIGDTLEEFTETTDHYEELEAKHPAKAIMKIYCSRHRRYTTNGPRFIL